MAADDFAVDDLGPHSSIDSRSHLDSIGLCGSGLSIER